MAEGAEDAYLGVEEERAQGGATGTAVIIGLGHDHPDKAPFTVSALFTVSAAQIISTRERLNNDLPHLHGLVGTCLGQVNIRRAQRVN